jgi:hypothetical protein
VTEIEAIERALEVKLPTRYRKFLLKYGAIRSDDLAILGINRDLPDLSVLQAAVALRIAQPHLRRDLVPIEDLGRGFIAALVCPTASGAPAPVVRVRLDAPSPDDTAVPLASGFAEYATGRLREVISQDRGWTILRQRVAEFDREHAYDHAKGGKLPRPHVWRPYRYCIQDVVFGCLVLRQDRDRNCLVVDTFLAANVPEYEPDAGALALTVFLLCEAYKCGSTLEIGFTNNVEAGHVPASIRRIARRFDVSIRPRNHLAPDDSRHLFAALTEFSPDVQNLLRELHGTGRLSTERACYAVHHGVWTRPETETIILSSSHPDRILGGEAVAERRHRYLEDIGLACGALLGGILDRQLASREHTNADGRTFELEGDHREVDIEFDPESFCKIYRCEEELPVPWLVEPSQTNVTIPPGTAAHVLVRARDAASLRRFIKDDIGQAAARAQATGAPTYLLVPADFRSLGDLAGDAAQLARGGGTGILVCPEAMGSLLEDAADRLARSRVMRND